VLSEGVLDGAKVGLCRDCHGILLSSEHFAKVVAERRELQGSRRSRIEPIDPSEFRRMIRCPQCGNRADTHVYGGGGNAVIDSCARCRLVWLDAGELTVLEQYGVGR
jgi:Zn-finger nucleic acid-binding protein